jgi:hypothetical protein
MNPTIDDWVHLMETVSDRPYALAVTLTFRNWCKVAQQALNRDIGIRTVIDLIRRLNREVFNHSAKRRGNTIGSVAVVGRNRADGHLHAHLALTAPPHMSDAEFAALTEKVITRFNWINKQYRIEPYRNSLWLRYMAKHGTESLALDCFNEAKP